MKEGMREKTRCDRGKEIRRKKHLSPPPPPPQDWELWYLAEPHPQNSTSVPSRTPILHSQTQNSRVPSRHPPPLHKTILVYLAGHPYPTHKHKTVGYLADTPPPPQNTTSVPSRTPIPHSQTQNSRLPSRHPPPLPQNNTSVPSRTPIPHSQTQNSRVPSRPPSTKQY